MDSAPAGPRRLRTAFGLSDRGEAQGYACDPDALSTRHVIEILADGLPIGLMRADQYRHDLHAAGWGDGCFGFVAVLPKAVLVGDVVLEARLANSGETVGSPLVADRLEAPIEPAGIAEVRWAGGLRLTGWLADRRSFGQRIKAIVDGRVAAEALANTWTHRPLGSGYSVVPAFDLHLPISMADGRVRHVEVVVSDGSAIRGTPCFVIAFEDGLEAFIDSRAELNSEKMRARYTDRLIPQSLPFADFPHWSERFPPGVEPRSDRPEVAVILAGEAGIDVSAQSLAVQNGVASVMAAIPLDARSPELWREDVLSFLREDAPRADLIVFAVAGTAFAPSALPLLADALRLFPDARSVYCDFGLRSPDGSLWPIALTAFDYERCLEQGYCSQVFAMRREAVILAIGNGADSVLRLFGAQLDAPLQPSAEPVHLPIALAEWPDEPEPERQALLRRAALAHFAARGLTCDVGERRRGETSSMRIMRPPATADLVSIVVSTRNGAAQLEALERALRATSGSVATELIVADGDTSDPAALALIAALAGQGARTVRVSGAYNAFRVRNAGAARATGRYILFLDDSLCPVEPGWLDDMVGRITDPGVGAVGPLILWPSGVVEAAGLVLGPGLAVAPAQAGRLRGDPGYAGLLEAAHEVSAVLADCMLVRRDLFVDAKGFDADAFVTRFSDVDLCLRVRAEGLRVVVTPDACLIRTGAAPLDLAAAGLTTRAARELDVLQARWGEVIAADPYYSPWLALDDRPHSALAWPPRSREPRQRHHVGARRVPLGL